jgi:enoyl-[acyl-carrier protein] reductase II
MALTTRLTRLLGIEYPIIQGGMAWTATWELAAAVSNAGGLGIIGAGQMPTDLLRDQIRSAKSATDKPFGVNLMLLTPHIDELVQMVLDEGVSVVTTGAGNPGKYMYSRSRPPPPLRAGSSRAALTPSSAKAWRPAATSAN